MRVVGECFFWYRLTRVFPDKFHRAVKRLCVCVHLLQSVAPSLFNLRVWKCFCTASVQVFFGLPLDLALSTSYSIYFFTQSLSSFHSICPYHCNLFCCSIKVLLSNPSLSFSLFFNYLLGTLSFTLMPHIYLTILTSACWNATSFSFLTGQVSLPCNILFRTQLLYNILLTVNDISLLFCDYLF